MPITDAILIVLFMCLVVIHVSARFILNKAGHRLSLGSMDYLYRLLAVSGCPTRWTFYMLVPVVNFYFFYKLCISLAKRFGKDKRFGILLTVFPMIFFPILAFGNSMYNPSNKSN